MYPKDCSSRIGEPVFMIYAKISKDKCIKRWVNWGNLILWCFVSGNKAILDTVIALRMCFVTVISDAHEIERSKNWVAKKMDTKNLSKYHHFFDCTPSLYATFSHFFHELLSFLFEWHIFLMTPKRFWLVLQ